VLVAFFTFQWQNILFMIMTPLIPSDFDVSLPLLLGCFPILLEPFLIRQNPLFIQKELPMYPVRTLSVLAIALILSTFSTSASADSYGGGWLLDQSADDFFAQDLTFIGGSEDFFSICMTLGIRVSVYPSFKTVSSARQLWPSPTREVVGLPL
jgi:hypothetical protein